MQVPGSRPQLAAVLNKLRFYYQMDEKQNQPELRVRLICKNCGGMRFVSRDDLSEDESIVSERFGESLFLKNDPGVLVCARCLFPTRAPVRTA